MQEIRKCISKVREYNNHAEIYVCFSNAGYTNQEQYDGYFDWYEETLNMLKSDGLNYYYQVIEGVPYWLDADKELYVPDLLHPNSKGSEIIAGHMLNMLNSKR